VERGWGEVTLPLLTRFLRPFRGRHPKPEAPAQDERPAAPTGASLARYLVVGLGNPGPKYAGSRHNTGAACVSRLAKRHGVDLRASKLANSGSGIIEGSEVTLLQPRTWYNNSGDAVIHFMQRDHVPIEHVIVLYDDLDLPEGRLRLRPSGSDGGNNGLKSIIQATNSRDFGRIRIGIGRPLDRGLPSWDPDVVIKHVLGTPPRDSRPIVEAAIDRTCDAVESIIRNGWERTMDIYNRVEQ
jgi:PTH1 family peptidyl-tRNA hydrolase